MVRCHSYADGYWADIARTYHIGPIEGRKQQMFEAVFAARDAVLAAIRPGVRAAELDQIARAVFESHDLGAGIQASDGARCGIWSSRPYSSPAITPEIR